MSLMDELLEPTAAEADAYAQCVAFDHQRFLERVGGRSGRLPEADEEAHAIADQVVTAAFARGVGFNREAGQ